MTTFPSPIIFSILVVIFSLILRRTLFHPSRKGAKYPPSPPRFFASKNERHFEGSSWETYRKWSKQYGSDLILLKSVGTPTLIINSYAAAKELLEKRSGIYSDRPNSHLTMLQELCGVKFMFGLQSYGSEWRDGRKAFHRVFSQAKVPMFRLREVKEVRKLLLRLLRRPEDYLSHLRLMAGSISISIAYGFETLEENDPYISHAEETMRIINLAYFGKYMVDHIPLLKYVPEWLPGAGFKTTARVWRETVMWTINVPWERTKELLLNDPSSVPDSAAKTLIQETVEPASVEDSAYVDRIAKSAVASIYIAGADTTLALFETFLLAMVLYPDVQRQVQHHIDRDCKGGLPDFSHYDSLPYVHAVLKECLRWHPVAALNVPHRVMEDDVYEGQFIPKGATVVVNNWAITQDPDVYTDPDLFNPERYLKSKSNSEGDASLPELDPGMPDPMNIVFGYGRRICPGRFMAYESMWITIASMLSMFNIEKPKDASGEDITPVKAFCEGFASRPLPFSCRIVPRSPRHEEVVLQTDDMN